MFQLTMTEFESLRFQIETLKQSISSQIVMISKSKRPKPALPYAFTKKGVAMLSGILNSEKAISMPPGGSRSEGNIAIMRAFVEIRKIIFKENDLKEQLKQIKNHLGGHDAQVSQIYDVPIAREKFIR